MIKIFSEIFKLKLFYINLTPMVMRLRCLDLVAKMSDTGMELKIIIDFY
jgi:hypothetical protein